MNISISKPQGRHTGCTDLEWEARVELAAAYRLVDHHGWGESIYNHISLRVPDQPDHMLIKPHVLTYAEVTASDLIKVSLSGDLDESAGINRAGYVLHAGILGGRADVNAVLHLHTEAVVAISARRAGLRMLSQYAVRFYEDIAYHDYAGITDGMAERAAILENLGSHRALIMRNHGALTVGSSVRAAFIAVKDLIDACRIQLLIESTGGEAIEIPVAVCESASRQMRAHDSGRGGADWPAYLRLLDKLDPGYRT